VRTLKDRDLMFSTSPRSATSVVPRHQVRINAPRPGRDPVSRPQEQLRKCGQIEPEVDHLSSRPRGVEHIERVDARREGQP